MDVLSKGIDKVFKSIFPIEELSDKATLEYLSFRLEKSKFLAGNVYSIADIATFPWIARHPIHDIGLKNFSNLSRWYQEISKRNAVIKGFDGLKNGEKIPKI